jgi:hypothetical protein
MCNDSQFVFVDVVSSVNHDTFSDRHTYSLYNTNEIKDSVETLSNNTYEFTWLSSLKLVTQGNETSVVTIDLFYNQVVEVLRKGTIDKTIDKYSPWGPFAGRIKIIEFIKP